MKKKWTDQEWKEAVHCMAIITVMLILFSVCPS